MVVTQNKKKGELVKEIYIRQPPKPLSRSKMIVDRHKKQMQKIKKVEADAEEHNNELVQEFNSRISTTGKYTNTTVNIEQCFALSVEA